MMIDFMTDLANGAIPFVNIFAPGDGSDKDPAQRLEHVTKEWFKELLTAPKFIWADIVKGFRDSTLLTRLHLIDQQNKPMKEISGALMKRAIADHIDLVRREVTVSYWACFLSVCATYSANPERDLSDLVHPPKPELLLDIDKQQHAAVLGLNAKIPPGKAKTNVYAVAHKGPTKDLEQLTIAAHWHWLRYLQDLVIDPTEYATPALFNDNHGFQNSNNIQFFVPFVPTSYTYTQTLQSALSEGTNALSERRRE